MRTYVIVARSCVIRLVKRRRHPFVRITHAELGNGLADSLSHRSGHIFAVCAKVHARRLLTMAGTLVGVEMFTSNLLSPVLTTST